VDGEQTLATVEPPRGRYPGRVDDKGRLKLPTSFQQYFMTLPEKRLFVTSFDRRIAQIYSLDVWREKEILYGKHKEAAPLARKAAFNALDLGSESEMDNQGRILISPDLRRALEIENQTVQLFAYPGRVEVMSDRVYKQRQKAAELITDDEVAELEASGLI
jgi:MraZ protein